MIFFFDDTSKINKTSLLHVNRSLCFVICPEGLRSTLDSIFDATVEIHAAIQASGGYENVYIVHIMTLSVNGRAGFQAEFFLVCDRTRKGSWLCLALWF